MANSRLRSNIKRQAIHNVIIVTVGFIIIIVILVVFGSTLLTNFSLFVEKSQGNTDNSTSTSDQNDSFIAPPTLNPVASATNKPQVDVSGYAQKNRSIILYVNNQIVDKSDVSDNGKFHFTSVQLHSGQNTIQVKAEEDNKRQSDFSNTDTISYLKNPPNLSISSPQDGKVLVKIHLHLSVLTARQTRVLKLQSMVPGPL